jgi:uncharacterized membrane protein
MNWYLWLKWLHVLSSTILFGTGLGIAFFFVRAQRSNSVSIVASVARDVVLADLVFTATAVFIQPSRASHWLYIGSQRSFDSGPQLLALPPSSVAIDWSLD